MHQQPTEGATQHSQNLRTLLVASILGITTLDFHQLMCADSPESLMETGQSWEPKKQTW